MEDGAAISGDPGKYCEGSWLIQRVAEGVIFASRLADEFLDTEQLAIQCRYTGLLGRRLIWMPYRRVVSRENRTDEVFLKQQATLRQTQDNLTEFIHTLLQPLFEHFGFFDLQLDKVQKAVQDLRKFRS